METKFHTLQPWLHEILESIRRDIKTDYLPASAVFCRTYFGNRPLNRLTMEEIKPALVKELLLGNQELADWVVNRWVFKHGEVYSHFATRLEAIRPDFASLEKLSELESEQILCGAPEEFGAKPVYFFSVLNDVVFPQSTLDKLHSAVVEVDQAADIGVASAADVVADEKHRKEISRLHEKYEQKMAGVMKKYATDVDALRAQVRALQKRVG